MDKDIIVVIPARSGSQGLPGKNMFPLGKYSLLGIAIEHGKQIGRRVIVSSDSLEYGDYAASLGAEFHLRKNFLANNAASTYATVVGVLSDRIYEETYVAVLQTTNPFRMLQSIKKKLAHFKLGFESGMAMRPVGGFLHNENDMEPFNRTWDRRTRRQERVGYLEDTGEFFICRVAKLAAHPDLVWQGCYPFLGTGICDIDTAADYELAKRLWRDEFIAGIDFADANK